MAKKGKQKSQPKAMRREQDQSESSLYKRPPGEKRKRHRVTRGTNQPTRRSQRLLGKRLKEEELKNESAGSKGNGKSPGRGEQPQSFAWTVVIVLLLVGSLCFFLLFLCLKGCVTSICKTLCDKLCDCQPLGSEHT